MVTQTPLQLTYKELPLKAISMPRHRWSRGIPSDDDLDVLTESLQSYGQLTPVLVRPLPDRHRYQLLSGRRRYRALKRLRAPTIRCMVVHTSDDRLAKRLALLEALGAGMKKMDAPRRGAAFKELVDMMKEDIEAERQAEGDS